MTTFCTQPLNKEEELKFKTYIHHLDEKINKAMERQEFMLKFNYRILKNLKDKLEKQTNSYFNKMSQKQAKMNSEIDQSDATNYIQLLLQFREKLQINLKNFQLKINAKKEQIKILQAQAKGKREKLKEKLKNNRNEAAKVLQKNGIKTKMDIIRLTETKSTKKFLPPIFTTRKTSLASIKKYDTQQTLVSVSDKYLYKLCLKAMLESIKEGKDDGNRVLFSERSHQISSEEDNEKTEVDNLEDPISWSQFRKLDPIQLIKMVFRKDKKCIKLLSLLS